MLNADELFASGDIRGAREALINQVRSEPGSVPVRMFLFQLFSLTGEWKRAKSQLDTLAKLDPEMQMLSVAYSQCIAAEMDRERVFAGEADMPILSRASWGPELSETLKGFFNKVDGAANKLLELQNNVPDCKGIANDDMAFDWISNADPRIGPATEAIISGRYGLVPFADLETLEIHKPVDLRDTIWVQAEFGLRKGAKVSGFIPMRYPGSHASEDSAVVMGRTTVWEENNGLETAMGHNLLAMSDGEDHSLLSFEKIKFETS